MERSPATIKMVAKCDNDNTSGASSACLQEGILMAINKMSGMLSVKTLHAAIPPTFKDNLN